MAREMAARISSAPGLSDRCTADTNSACARTTLMLRSFIGALLAKLISELHHGDTTLSGAADRMTAMMFGLNDGGPPPLATVDAVGQRVGPDHRLRSGRTRR